MNQEESPLLPFLTWIDYLQLNDWPLTICGIILLFIFLPNKHKRFIFFHYCTLQIEWSIIWYQTKPNALLIKIRVALCWEWDWINIKLTWKTSEKRNNSSSPLLSYMYALYSHNQYESVVEYSGSYKYCATFSENHFFYFNFPKIAKSLKIIFEYKKIKILLERFFYSIYNKRYILNS